MSIRFTAKARRGVVTLAVATGLALGVAGCGSGGGDDEKPQKAASASKDTGSKPSTQEGQSDVPLAEVKGPTGLLLQITSVARDSGGFVTVSGNLKNDSGKSAVIPAQLSGNETEVLRHGRSLGGATLVDSKGKKRYYVLRDTDGRPLTTTGIATVRSGESLPVFMQFPAPPSNVTEVTFELPMFASAPVQISG
ncbi:MULTISPECIES: hypothetical protein [unclassified Streptomyces]|uniref:hypothetical protein n=1 Tax=unclassified Streptomyces TaxID=2593676 RepID=UPI001F04D133|nr:MULTISPECIES: hypothetical protein [unclassified Streptomyces]MCH0563584.1 hypothetical protein [Streptomyces sp. MUM 2J]MCH0570968.1 hypothetical protein [Streptomyces sp. MUM 136J]